MNVLDLTPPAAIQGVGSNTAMIVGEFDNGPYNVPTAVLSSSDFPNVWGALGYTVNGVPCQYPSAVQRSADAAVVPEYWNGNGFLALNGKQFAALVVVRVNTSTGSVTFNSLAYLTGAVSGTYGLASGQELSLDVDGTTTAATFTGVAATVTGTGATLGSITAGLTATLAYDGNPSFTVYFQAGDTTISNVVARINQYAGFTFASNSSSQVKLTGRQAGTGGSVHVVSGTALTDLGLTVATTAGTGNVGNIAAVTFAEVQTVVQGAISDTAVSLDQNGALRISDTGVPNTGVITVAAATTAAALGFAVGATNSAATSVQAGSLIPAGTVVSDGGSNTFVTTQDVTLTTSAGPYSVPVRYAVDNGTGAGVAANTVTTLVTVPTSGSFTVDNPLPITAAMTEGQLDAAYVNAINTTTSLNSVAKTVNISWAARHSIAVRNALRTNAINASAGGCFGRMACVSPPLNTASSAALAGPASVQATRDQRTIYCYIGANTFVPQIASTGTTAGGVGFTATGNIDQTSDGLMACILSQLPPEENPGQDTPFLSAFNGIETGANVQNFGMGDYIAFKAAGIAALRYDADDGTLIFQSGVTSVDPQTNPSLVRISRRRMADFIEDSLAAFSTSFGKKLSTKARRKALASEYRAFLRGLLGANTPGSQRINGYTVDETSGNTAVLLQQGLYRIIVKVQTLVSLDSIVIQSTIGDSVSVAEMLPAAA